MVGHAAAEATGRKAKAPKNDVSGRDVVVLGSGNLGLVYLMEKTADDARGARGPPSAAAAALRSHPHVGWVLVQSGEHGAVVLGGGAPATSRRTVWKATTRSRASTPTARSTSLRTHGFAHAPDLLVGSFYDPALDEGCAFEELISFHGGLGGSQTRAVPALPGAAARARRTARRRRDAPPRARRVAAPARGRPRVAGRAGAGPGAGSWHAA